ncbi:ARM repeat-containing protein [Rhizophagus irregularis]|uniref:ARM repeat-containing protein n=2 Tax=Rhizophagus irregularis TaxID=588596 RepID=A0A2I1ELB3_9GLOM|nr:armadillo-type protein [Rhizophagus irregularis DAOM 181602=DAOM 197198]PKC09368.1 ARM repeat-containing protein [Rhizophagus irregularis]PKK69385.1 ARM repeat-containing protein [Rhizophagus irregularis]PKY22907.1 ARM repeat-containing protein [Rhizophagus irregularis]POG65947.1 armadillo-type protein [Rhizophagus irregularis DAOM 181602=DAOM 197198]|eukprot:XP_025172813.1 armadillo-type protein [Rhizophagus irregularis DAOM 181602=DAOM 197198]
MSSPRDQLLQTLAEATSQQPERIKLAEVQLKQWEVVPEFYITLLEIINDKSVDVNIRFFGVIFFKNGVDKYWRKTAKSTINPEEKAKIRSQLLSFMDESHNQLATQSAVLVSKIARIDFPNEWPDLLQNLLSIIHSTMNVNSAILIQKRAILTLHLVVKALCSKTFGPDRKMFEQIAPELLRNVASIYVEHTNRFFNMISTSNDIVNATDLETSLIALKSIRRLIVHGFQDISKVDETKAFFVLAFDHLQKFYTLRNSSQDTSSPIFELLDSKVNLIGKFYIELQKLRPISFIMTPGSRDVIHYYWQLLVMHKMATQPYGTEKILIQALLLLKGIIRKSSYNQDIKESEDLRISDAMKILEEQILTQSFVESFAELLISSYLILRKEDLVMWEEDPEGWVNFDEIDHWEYQIRPCAEKVFTDLITQCRDLLSPKILKLLENAALTQSDNLLVKDAIYCAVGLGSHELYDVLDFDSWLVNNLLIEAANNDPRQDWIDYIFIRVDEWDFDSDGFVPYLDRAITLLTRLIGEVEQFESRLKILNCLSLIVERMDSQIAPFSEKITNLLPTLWQVAQSEYLFKPAILVILTKLVQALWEQSVNLHEFIIPIIQYSVSPNTEEHVYLLEDGLDLWLAILENTVECTPLLFNLVPAAIGLLEFGSETLKRVLRIIESYILLVPEMIVQSYSIPIMDAFTRLFGDLRPEACRAIIYVIDVTLQACPFGLLKESIISTGLLGKLLNTIISVNEENPYVLVSYVSILARIIINDPVFFLHFITIASQQYNIQQEDLLKKVLETWLDKFDNIGHPKQRKLSAMAFATLIATTNSTILGFLAQFIGVWCDVLSEVKESGGGDALVYWQEEYVGKNEIDDSDASPETKRKRALLQRDPIHTTNLIHYINLKIGECEALNGGPEMFRQKYLSRVDNTLLDQLKGLMNV